MILEARPDYVCSYLRVDDGSPGFRNEIESIKTNADNATLYSIATDVSTVAVHSGNRAHLSRDQSVISYSSASTTKIYPATVMQMILSEHPDYVGWEHHSFIVR
jgi:hypothetical protein